MTEATEPTLTVHITTPDGVQHHLPALPGWRLMEIIRDHGLPIRAECGGSCACATCHVVLAADWASQFPEPKIDELDMLDGLDNAQTHSRLSCQLLLTEAHDGLAATLIPD